MPYVYFLTICLLFGSNFYLMKLASTYYGPASVGAWRVLEGAAVLAVLWRLTARSERLPKRLVLVTAIIGVVCNGYPYAMQPWLIAQGVEHSYLAMTISLTPMSIMAFSIPLLGVWPSARQLVGVVIGLGFMALLLLDGHDRGVAPWLLALMVTVPLSYGVANAYMKRELGGAAPLPVTCIMLLSAGALVLPFSAAGSTIGLRGPAEPGDWVTATVALAILGCLGTGLAMWLWVRLVGSQGPLFTGMATYVVPVIALLWGRFDGEQVTTKQLIAMTGILTSVAIVQYGAAARPSPSNKPEPLAEPVELPCADEPCKSTPTPCGVGRS